MKATLWNSLSSSALTCHKYDNYMGFYFGFFFRNSTNDQITREQMEKDSHRIHVTLTDVDRAEISRLVDTV